MYYEITITAEINEQLHYLKFTAAKLNRNCMFYGLKDSPIAAAALGLPETVSFNICDADEERKIVVDDRVTDQKAKDICRYLASLILLKEDAISMVPQPDNYNLQIKSSIPTADSILNKKP